MFALGLVLSLAIGISLGLFGGGGSILTVPVLHYVFRVEAHDAIAMSLIVVGATSLVAVVPHARAGRVRWRVGLAFGAASVVTAFAGGRLGAMLAGEALIAAFALVMLAAGGAMLVRARVSPATGDTGDVRMARVIAVGLGTGLLTGLLGAGGGFVIVPALTLFGGLAIRDAVGTSLLVIALNSLAGLAGVAGHAELAPRIAVSVTCVALAGSLLGARGGRRLSAQTLQGAFGWLVILVGGFILVHQLG
ncbi:MAG TPA: sulfite exporter TauE/SafE family protein [Kofleriaceae bacterium]